MAPGEYGDGGHTDWSLVSPALGKTGKMFFRDNKLMKWNSGFGKDADLLRNTAWRGSSFPQRTVV